LGFWENGDDEAGDNRDGDEEVWAEKADEGEDEKSGEEN
jgi:hypothetical protein